MAAIAGQVHTLLLSIRMSRADTVSIDVDCTAHWLHPSLNFIITATPTRLAIILYKARYTCIYVCSSFFFFFFFNLRPSRSTQTVPGQQCSLAEQRLPEQLITALLLASVISSSSSLCSIDSRRSIEEAGRKR